MFVEYQRLDGINQINNSKGRWSLFGALVFTFLGVCAVSLFMHQQPPEFSLGAETPVGAECKDYNKELCKLPECSWQTIGSGVTKTQKCAPAISPGGCFPIEGLEEAEKVGVGMECEIQTQRWYSPDYKTPANYQFLTDPLVKHSCGWGYKTVIGTVYWSLVGDTNDNTTYAFDITGEEHCIIELVTPPLTVNVDGNEKTLMNMAILAITRVSFVTNTYPTLSLGEVFDHLNMLHAGNKEKADWQTYIDKGNYRTVWKNPKDNHVTDEYLKDDVKANWDTSDFQSKFYPRMTAPTTNGANPNFEYKPPIRNSGPGKLVWQANVNVPIFFWDTDTKRPESLSSDAKLKPLSTLSAVEFVDRKDKILNIENPMVRSLCALFKNEGLTYANNKNSVLSKAGNAAWEHALPYRKPFAKKGNQLTLLDNIKNMKNWQPWLNKAMWKSTYDFEWSTSTEADRVHKLLNNNKPPFLFNEYTYKPVLYKQTGQEHFYPYGVAESRVGDSTLINLLKGPNAGTFGDLDTNIGTFFDMVKSYQDVNNYGGTAQCAALGGGGNQF